MLSRQGAIHCEDAARNEPRNGFINRITGEEGSRIASHRKVMGIGMHSQGLSTSPAKKFTCRNTLRTGLTIVVRSRSLSSSYLVQHRAEGKEILSIYERHLDI